MNKETILVLIEKEISELSALTKGFSQLDEFPQPLVNLAIEKANNLRDCLEKLTKRENTVVEEIKKEEPVVPEIKVEEEQVTQPIEEVQKAEVHVEPVTEQPACAPEEIAIEAEPEIEVVIEDEEEEVDEESAEESDDEEYIEADIELDEDQEETDEVVEGPQIVAETIHKAESVVDSFSHQTDNSVASNLAHQHISDVKEALSIADRFRFQRELFEGNGEKLTKTLDIINSSNSFEQVMNYFTKNFHWNFDDVTVKDFLELAQRRFA